MNQDINAPCDAAHNSQTNEDDWEDDGLNYSDELKKLPLGVRYGSILCAMFEVSTPGHFSWEAIPALRIYNVACELRSIKGLVSDLHAQGLSKEDLLSGIEIYKSTKSSAAPWAHSLTQKLEAVDNNYTAGSGSIFDVAVDEFVSDVADEDVDLGQIRKTDPILFGEICLETSRLLTARQQA